MAYLHLIGQAIHAWLRDVSPRLGLRNCLLASHTLAKGRNSRLFVHYGNQSRAYLIGGRPLWPPAVPQLAARSSQSNPRGSGPEVLKRERGHVTAETGVAEVGVFRALQPNVWECKLTHPWSWKCSCWLWSLSSLMCSERKDLVAKILHPCAGNNFAKAGDNVRLDEFVGCMLPEEEMCPCEDVAWKLQTGSFISCVIRWPGHLESFGKCLKSL